MTEEKKMSSFEKASLVLALFAGWGVVFFGVWAVYLLSDFYKILIDALWSFGFILTCILYANWSKFSPKLQLTIIRLKTNFGLIFVVVAYLAGILEGCLAVYQFTTSWQVFSVNDVPVFTYSNLISSSLIIGGGYIIIFSVGQLRNVLKLRKKKIRKLRKKQLAAEQML
jgi:hypothetical protein